MALRDTANGQIIFNEDTAVEIKRGKSIKTEPRPSLIVSTLKSWKPDIVCIEDVGIVPIKDGRKQGTASSAQFMRAKGMLEGLCAGMGLSYEMVAPQRWQRDLRCRSGHDEARAKVLEIFPLLAPQMKLKKNHDRAAALLLALWVERILLPNHPLYF